MEDMVDTVISLVGQAGLNQLLWNHIIVYAIPICKPITFFQALEATTILSIAKYI